MSDIKSLLGPMRLPFLILPPACVLLGLGTAMWSQGYVNYFYFALALIGAVSAHISVNAFNEYFDFKSGLDAKTERTPFSGGSGTLPANPHLEKQAFMTSSVSFMITAAIGIFFLYVYGFALLPLGLLGLVIVVIYTPFLTHNPFLCLIAPGLGFGPLMVMGTHFVLTGRYSWTAFIASLVPFFLVNNLLLLNQFPDVNPDKSIGRKHFPICIGKRKSSVIYGLFLVLAYLSIVSGIYFNYLPKFSLLGLITLVLAVPLSIGAYRNAEGNTKKLLPFMGMNVIVNITTPILVSVGLFVG
jgi:1,4-dihydroxy-2-naphthoate octaprenyltransferase